VPKYAVKTSKLPKYALKSYIFILKWTEAHTSNSIVK